MNGKMIKLITVVLNFPTVIAVFIVYAKAIYMAMFENPNFTASAAKVTKLNTDITALDAAETGCKTSPPTKTVEERNAALEKVKADLRSLRNDVQEVADADPANADAIIARLCGFAIRAFRFWICNPYYIKQIQYLLIHFLQNNFLLSYINNPSYLNRDYKFASAQLNCKSSSGQINVKYLNSRILRLIAELSHSHIFSLSHHLIFKLPKRSSTKSIIKLPDYIS